MVGFEEFFLGQTPRHGFDGEAGGGGLGACPSGWHQITPFCAQGYGISKPVLPEKILAARSAADFVEDKEILAYIKQLQDQTDLTSQLFDDTKKAPQIH